MDRILDNLQKQQDKESQIVEGSKLLAEYLGYFYAPFNNLQGYHKAGWYKPATRFSKSNTKGEKGWATYLVRGNKDLRFFNSYDWLFEVIEKLEKEDLKEYFDEGNFMQLSVDRFDGKWSACINLNYDPPRFFLQDEEYLNKLPDREQLFWVLCEAVSRVKEIKNGRTSE